MTTTASKQPVVLHFQPKDFKVFSTPEELKQWERMMKDEVGFKVDMSNLSGTCSECSCAGSTDDCDVD
jgi:hypothetical protein